MLLIRWLAAELKLYGSEYCPAELTLNYFRFCGTGEARFLRGREDARPKECRVSLHSSKHPRRCLRIFALQWFRERRSWGFRRLFWASCHLSSGWRVQNLRFWWAGWSRWVGFRVWDLCVRWDVHVRRRVRWWFAWRWIWLNLLRFNDFRYSLIVRLVLRVPWLRRYHWWYRVPNRAWWCWDGWWISGSWSRASPASQYPYLRDHVLVLHLPLVQDLYRHSQTTQVVARL